MVPLCGARFAGSTEEIGKRNLTSSVTRSCSDEIKQVATAITFAAIETSEIRLEKMTDVQEKDLTTSGIGDTFRQIISHMKVGGSADDIYACLQLAASYLARESSYCCTLLS